MKVDFVVRYFHPEIGGTESYVFHLAERFVRMGHEVTVHTSNRGPSRVHLPGSDFVDGIRIRRYPLLVGANLIPRLDAPEIVHVTSFGYNPNVVEPIRRRTPWLVFTPIAMFMGQAYRFVPPLFIRWLARRYSRIVSLTESEARDFLNRFDVNKERLAVIPAGVPDEAFEEPVDGEVSLASSLVRQVPDYILSLGRVVITKRLWVGIQALPYLPEGVHYVIAGPILDRALYKNLVQLALRLGVSRRVHFLGTVGEREKRLLLSRAIAHLSSGYEAFSIASVEAMAQSTPVVAARMLGLTDLVSHRETGLIFDYDSPTSAATCIRELMENRAEAAELGARARAQAWAKYRWVNVSNSMLKLYDDVLRGECNRIIPRSP